MHCTNQLYQLIEFLKVFSRHFLNLHNRHRLLDGVFWFQINNQLIYPIHNYLIWLIKHHILYIYVGNSDFPIIYYNNIHSIPSDL